MMNFVHTKIRHNTPYYLLLLLVIISCLSVQTSAAPKPKYWPVWDKSNPENKAGFNFQSWQNFLNHYRIDDKKTKMGLVAYDRVNEKDNKKLVQFITYLTSLDPRDYSKSQQEAYWINLYNALTVELILKHYPVSSIIKLGKGWFKFGPWDDVITKVADISLTLNDIEHRILRPLWKDYRVHYALNCASMSCPDLAPVAYTAENMNKLLDAQAKRYINQPKGVHFNKHGKLELSSIYKWYGSDFGDRTTLFTHLEHYANPVLASKLQAYKGSVKYHYDWSLNEIK